MKSNEFGGVFQLFVLTHAREHYIFNSYEMQKQILHHMIINITNFFMKLFMCLSQYSEFWGDVEKFFQIFDKDCKKNGYVYNVKRYKQVKLHVTRYMCGQPLLVNKLVVGVDRTGWPKRALLLKPLFDHSNFGKVLVLTILSITRCYKYGDGYSPKITSETVKSITDMPEGNFVIPHGFIKKFVSMLGNPKIDLNFSKSDVYLSTKSSINGPATLTAVDSARNLDARQFLSLSKLTCQKGFDYLVKLISLGKVSGPEPYFASKCDAHRSPYSGKLSFVFDPDFKLRVIAIFDYPSQLVLKKIHSGLMNILRSISTDRTFTQDPKFEIDLSQKLWSMDLSNATDRFPVQLQRRLLSEIIGYEQSLAWKQLMTDRLFEFGTDDSVEYAVGQPMGAYSSWAAFTLSHHLVVQYCASLCGYREWFTKYIILGDDIVINDDAVAEQYKRIIGRLGVELSLAKTHVSLDTYEFAKRWIRVSEDAMTEISPLPISGIIENLYNPLTVYTIFFSYSFMKGNFLPYRTTLKEFIKDLYKDLKVIKHSSLTLRKRVKNSKKINLVRKIKKTVLYPRLSFKDFKGLCLFDFALKLSLGWITERQTREFVAEHLPESLHNVPPVELISEILERGYRSQVNLVVPKLEQLVDRVGEMMRGSSLSPDSGLPLFDSLLNRAVSIRQEFDQPGNWLSRLDRLVTVDIDSVLFPSKKTKPIDRLVHVGKALKKGIHSYIEDSLIHKIINCDDPVELEYLMMHYDDDLDYSEIESYGSKGSQIGKLPNMKFFDKYYEMPPVSVPDLNSRQGAGVIMGEIASLVIQPNPFDEDYHYDGDFLSEGFELWLKLQIDTLKQRDNEIDHMAAYVMRK